jgi:hypothetical protein
LVSKLSEIKLRAWELTSLGILKNYAQTKNGSNT